MVGQHLACLPGSRFDPSLVQVVRPVCEPPIAAFIWVAMRGNDRQKLPLLPWADKRYRGGSTPSDGVTSGVRPARRQMRLFRSLEAAVLGEQSSHLLLKNSLP